MKNYTHSCRLSRVGRFRTMTFAMAVAMLFLGTQASADDNGDHRFAFDKRIVGNWYVLIFSRSR